LLKQFFCQPCITYDGMKTISNTKRSQAVFKKTQFLPVLMPPKTVATGGAVALRAFRPQAGSPRPRGATSLSVSARLPRTQTDSGAAERVLFWLLAVSAAAVVGQSLASMIAMWPDRLLLNGWLARLLG